jgi:cytochrome c-type biogenesis protein
MNRLDHEYSRGLSSVELNGIIAFSAGILSFFAPCVLPLVPSYLIFISGVSIDHLDGPKTAQFKSTMLTHSIAFILGFSFVFIMLGISSSMIGQFLSTYQAYITRIGGILLIVMGLFTLNIIKIPFLSQEKMIQLKKKPLGFFGSFLVGIAFSLGWTPCIGPGLTSILIIASTEESTWKGAYLLSMYSLGFAIPFILSALLFDQLLRFIKRYGFIVKYTMKVMGVLLIIIGLLLVTANFHRFSTWMELVF